MAKKLLSITVATILFVTFLGSADASSSNNEGLFDRVGSEITKSNEDLRMVSEPSIFKIVDLTETDKVNLKTKVLDQKTYMVQQNGFLESNATQYVTDFVVMASYPSSMSDNGKDSKGLVHMFITVYWTKHGREDMYINLDKVSWRYEHSSDARTINSSKTYYQNGPGLDGKGKSQSKTLPEYGTTNPSDVPAVLSGTVATRDWGWNPVLSGGLATKVGMISDNTIAKVSNPKDKWGWRFGLLIEGTYPTYP